MQRAYELVEPSINFVCPNYYCLCLEKNKPFDYQEVVLIGTEPTLIYDCYMCVPPFETKNDGSSVNLES